MKKTLEQELKEARKNLIMRVVHAGGGSCFEYHSTEKLIDLLEKALRAEKRKVKELEATLDKLEQKAEEQWKNNGSPMRWKWI